MFSPPTPPLGKFLPSYVKKSLRTPMYKIQNLGDKSTATTSRRCFCYKCMLCRCRASNYSSSAHSPHMRAWRLISFRLRFFCLEHENQNAFCQGDHQFGSQPIACQVFAKFLLQIGRNSWQRSQQDQLDSRNWQTHVNGNYKNWLI